MLFSRLVISYDSTSEGNEAVPQPIRTEENVDISGCDADFKAWRDGVVVARLSTFADDCLLFTETGIEIAGLIEAKDKANFPAVQYVDWTLIP